MNTPKDKALTSVGVVLEQAIAKLQQGDLSGAEAAFQAILRQDPEHADAHHLLGVIALQRGQLEVAERLINRAIQGNSGAAMYHSNLGYVLQQQGRLQEALLAIERSIRLGSTLPETFCNGGNVLSALGRYKEALSAYDFALRQRPAYFDAHYGRGNVLLARGYAQEAANSYRRTLELNPQHAGACNNLAVALVGLDQPEAALEFCDRAIALVPNYAQAYNCRAHALAKLLRFEDALAACQKASELDPEYADVFYNRGNILRELGDVEAAECNYRRALALNPSDGRLHSNVLFVQAASAALTPEEMFDRLREWDDVHGRVSESSAIPRRQESVAARRLRIGYVSPNLRSSVVSFFFEPLLAAHDRTRFDVFCYACFAEARADMVTQRLRGLAEHWRFVGDDTDAEIAQRISNDGIDILVDLAGHTANNRLPVFAFRPAPVQATYLGFFASTGMAAMDYWITDETIHPMDTRELAAEEIYRLPRCWVCYRPPALAPAVHPCPTHGSDVVFGSFSHLSKLTPAVIETWSRLLQKLPASRLLIMAKALGDAHVCERLQYQFAAQGVAPERLILRKGGSYRQYFATYAEVDIVLDPFPRTGGTTTAEALWMGVPVVTLAGQRYVERISASKLTALGLTDLIAACREEYIDKASSLAKDPARRRDLRQGLRSRMAQSPLCDENGLARAMESAYTALWERYLAQSRVS